MSTASKMLSLAAFVFLSGRADGLKAGIDYAVVRSGETYSSFRGPGNNPERVCDPVRVVCPECKSNVRLHKGSSCHSVEWDHKEGCKRTTISKKAAAAARAAAAPPTALPTPETNADPLKNIISTTQGETEGEAREQEHMEQEGGRRLERSLFTALVRYLLRIFFRLPVRLLVYCSALSKTLFWCLVAVAVGFTVLFFLFMLGYYGKTFEKERNQPINGVLPTLLAIGLAVGWLDFANVATKWKAAGKELSQAEAHADMNSVEMVEFVSGLMGEDKVPKFGSFLIFAYGCIAKGFRYVVFLAAFQQTANSVAWFLYEEIAIIAGTFVLSLIFGCFGINGFPKTADAAFGHSAVVFWENVLKCVFTLLFHIWFIKSCRGDAVVDHVSTDGDVEDPTTFKAAPDSPNSNSKGVVDWERKLMGWLGCNQNDARETDGIFYSAARKIETDKLETFMTSQHVVMDLVQFAMAQCTMRIAGLAFAVVSACLCNDAKEFGLSSPTLGQSGLGSVLMYVSPGFYNVSRLERVFHEEVLAPALSNDKSALKVMKARFDQIMDPSVTLDFSVAHVVAGEKNCGTGRTCGTCDKVVKKNVCGIATGDEGDKSETQTAAWRLMICPRD